jgi:hypothetical protein
VDEECPAGNAAPGALKDVLTEAKFAEINSNKDPVMRKSDSNKNIAGLRLVSSQMFTSFASEIMMY